jgi:hypothetical protein
MKNITFLLAAVSILFTGCAIEQEFYFKQDFSGSYTTRIDMSSLGALGEEMNPDSIMKDTDLNELQTKYEAIAGLSNVRNSFSEGILLSGFDFNGMASLNKAFEPEEKAEDEEKDSAGLPDNSGLVRFEQKGKKLLVIVDKSDMADGGSEMEQMGEMITFSVKIGFDKKIKKVKSDVGTWDKANNSITLQFNLNDLSKKDKNLNSEITLK